jgi:murein DD-endopeptidase MepM/ murein hydrolase activator NlpD
MDTFETAGSTALESPFAQAGERPAWGETEHEFPSEWEQPFGEDEERFDPAEATQPWAEDEGGFATLGEGPLRSMLEGEDPPRSVGVPFAADPPPGSFWPVRTAHPRGGQVSYVAQNGRVGDGKADRAFGANRSGGRRHAAIDLFANAGDPVVACQDGQIVNFYRFNGPDAWAVIVAHQGVVINYGEVASDSLARLNLRRGSQVSAGQQIATIGRNPGGSTMLHFETYAPGTRANQRWLTGSPPPAPVRDPTRYLLAIRRTGQGTPGSGAAAGAPPQTQPLAGTIPTPSAPSGSVPADTPNVPLGTLELETPSRRWRYAFTREDLIWTAKLVVHEAGGEDDAENAAVIWAMFNRYALFTYRYYPSFTAFIRRYSTTLQPVLANPRAAARHYQKGDSVYRRTGGFYPGTQIPKGQLIRHLRIQAAPWSAVKESARHLATRALRGDLSNPGIGLASEFASTYVFFKQRYGRKPSHQEWRMYTQRLAAAKGWTFVGDVNGIDPTKNAFFVQNRVRSLPSNAVRVSRPASAGETEFQPEFQPGFGEAFADELGGYAESFEDEEFGEEFGQSYAEHTGEDQIGPERFVSEGFAAEQFGPEGSEGFNFEGLEGSEGFGGYGEAELGGEGFGEDELGEEFGAAEAFADESSPASSAEEERGLYEALET